MRRSTLLGTMVLPTLLLLSGCSGVGKFFGDTFSLPGMNPNLPYGLSENTDRARGENPAAAPILPEGGNIWPGPPQPLPTLSDVSRSTGNGLSSGNQNLGGQVGGAPALRDGGRMSMGEQDSIANGAETFSGGGTLSEQVPDAAPHYRPKSDGQAKPIVIPNGDGTYTVVGGDGTVKTVKSPPK